MYTDHRPTTDTSRPPAADVWRPAACGRACPRRQGRQQAGRHVGRHYGRHQHRRGQPAGAPLAQGGPGALHQPAQVQPQLPGARPPAATQHAPHGGLHDADQPAQQQLRAPRPEQHDATSLRQPELLPPMIFGTGRGMPARLTYSTYLLEQWYTTVDPVSPTPFTLTNISSVNIVDISTSYLRNTH